MEADSEGNPGGGGRTGGHDDGQDQGQNESAPRGAAGKRPLRGGPASRERPGIKGPCRAEAARRHSAGGAPPRPGCPGVQRARSCVVPRRNRAAGAPQGAHHSGGAQAPCRHPGGVQRPGMSRGALGLPRGTRAPSRCARAGLHLDTRLMQLAPCRPCQYGGYSGHPHPRHPYGRVGRVWGSTHGEEEQLERRRAGQGRGGAAGKRPGEISRSVPTGARLDGCAEGRQGDQGEGLHGRVPRRTNPGPGRCVEEEGPRGRRVSEAEGRDRCEGAIGQGRSRGGWSRGCTSLALQGSQRRAQGHWRHRQGQAQTRQW